jgi:hypothetical protein
MKSIFADTFYFLAYLSETDAAHDIAVDARRNINAPLLTTAWVLTELADALSAPPLRSAFQYLWETLIDDPNVKIIPPTWDLLEKGVHLFTQRPDKKWSLTDCISFVVMEEQGISDALTGAHHFEQAGFRALLKV